MNPFSLSWKNLTSRPLQMMLSLLLFALGVGLIALLISLNTQLEEKFEKNLAGIDLVVGAKGSPLQMILSSMYHIDAPTGNISVKEVKPFFNPKHPLIKLAVPLSLGDSYKAHRIIGTTHVYVDSIFGATVREGRLWQNLYEVTIGAKVSEKLGLKIGDKFKSSHGFVDDGINTHDHGEFKVVGILNKTGSVLDQLILTNTESVWDVHDHDHEAAEEEGETAHNHDDNSHDDHNHDHDSHVHDDHDHAHDEHDHDAHSHEGHDHGSHDHHDHDHAHDHNHDHEAAVVPAKPITDYPDKDITTLLVRYRNKKDWRALNMPRNINENTDMQAASPAIEMNRLYSIMGVGTDALRSLAMVIVVVSGLSIFISLFSSLKERKYELALMRVMGAGRGYLFFLIILEGLILAVIGYVLGLALCHIGMSVLSGYLEEAYQYEFSGWRFFKEEGYLLIGALGIGFVAALIPAWQAYRTDISETLTSH